jgi:hypothetical protein
MNPTRLVIILLTSLWVAAPASAARPSVARVAAWDRLSASMGAEAVVRWSAVDDVPISIRSGPRDLPLPGWTTDRATAVQGFFRDHADLFRLRTGIDLFEIAGEREKGAIHHLRAVQTYRGLRVRGGQYMVSVGAGGQLRMIAGRSVPDIDLEVRPGLTLARAIDAAIASLGRAPGRDSVSAELAIEPGDEDDRLVYEVRVLGRSEPFAREVLVDARDGTVTGVRDLGFGASGCAAVWDPNPNHPLSEDDFDIADPAAGVARLEGPQVRVLHQDLDESVSSTVLPQGCFDFRFDPVTQPEAFDQANVYGHVDHFLREFHGGNGFVGMPQPVTVILLPFVCGASNTAETIGNTVWLTSEGCGYKSATRDADVIDHEIQHTVNNAFGLEGGTDRSREIYATALHEGLANYFACAVHDDPIYGEYYFGPQGFANCNSDPAEYNYSRRLEIGIGNLQNYLLGMIWSGALWDIRTQIGPVMDRIALESLSYLPSAPSLHNAVDAVLQADRDQHGGVHQTEMIAAFAERGLGPDVPHATIVGPTAVVFGDSATWTADVCCGVAPYSYQWSRVPAGSEIPEPIGADASVTIAFTGSGQLRLRVVDAEGRAVLATLGVQVESAGTLSIAIEGPRQVLIGVPNRWTARVSGQGSIPVTYRWTIGGLQVIGDSMSVATILQGQSTLKVVASVGSGIISAAIVVTVDRPPIVTIPMAPLQLAPGASATLTGKVSGGVQPYTWRWTRNGTGPEHLIGTNETIVVTGDATETDIYLSVTTALGTRSNVFKHTISPLGVPLVVTIEGPDPLRFGSAGTWKAVFPGGQPPTTGYWWTRRCPELGCFQELIGEGPSVTIESARGFVLYLQVWSGTRTAETQRHISVQGVPTPTAAVPGPLRPALQMDQTIVRQGDELRFALEGPPGTPASLRVVDVAGREVAPLFEGRLSDGRESIGWRAGNLPSGVYLAQARIAGETFIRRMIVVR